MGSVINLPEISAQIFMQQGKIVPVQEKPQVANNELNYETYFQATTQRIAQDYKAGTSDYIRQKYPERFQESLQLESRLNDFWDKDFQEFKKAVDAWQTIEIELMKLFTQKTN
ncbi:MAG: hypothetical protein HZB37_02455 [Planctomycetes bacterium]|nr:hypothetical protein [Planctomycetota bacterium]